MAKNLVFVVLGLAIALMIVFSATPSKATSNDPTVYAWEYLAPGSDRLVCQKISLHLKSLPATTIAHSQPIHTHSQIVSDRLCADLSKPLSF